MVPAGQIPPHTSPCSGRPQQLHFRTRRQPTFYTAVRRASPKGNCLAETARSPRREGEQASSECRSCGVAHLSACSRSISGQLKGRARGPFARGASQVSIAASSHVLSRRLHMASLLCEKGVHLLYNLHPRQMKGAFLAAQVPRILSQNPVVLCNMVQALYSLRHFFFFFLPQNHEGPKNENHNPYFHST